MWRQKIYSSDSRVFCLLWRFGLPVTWLTGSETDRLVPCWAAVRLSGPWWEFRLFLENLNIESCILTPWSEITHLVQWSIYRHCTYLFKGDKPWLSFKLGWILPSTLIYKYTMLANKCTSHSVSQMLQQGFNFRFIWNKEMSPSISLRVPLPLTPLWHLPQLELQSAEVL